MFCRQLIIKLLSGYCDQIYIEDVPAVASLGTYGSFPMPT